MKFRYEDPDRPMHTLNGCPDLGLAVCLVCGKNQPMRLSHNADAELAELTSHLEILLGVATRPGRWLTWQGLCRRYDP